jgi:hypothetical protein
MSKTDDLRKKKAQLNTVVFTPRPSVHVEPLTQPQAPLKSESEVVEKENYTPKQKKYTSKKESTDHTELVALFAKVPKNEKRWLDHYRIDEGKDLGEVISEAIHLLQSKVNRS